MAVDPKTQGMFDRVVRQGMQAVTDEGVAEFQGHRCLQNLHAECVPRIVHLLHGLREGQAVQIGEEAEMIPGDAAPETMVAALAVFAVEAR